MRVIPGSSRKEQTVLAHALPGDTAFAACLRLFRQYPLAVRRHYAEHRFGSMVLMTRNAGVSRFFVLIMEWDDLFVLRHWDRRDGARVEIGRDDPIPAEIRQVIETGVPVPRDGALLGWVAGHQVRAVVAAYGRLPEPWDDASAVPGVLVMPHTGSAPAEWPPLSSGTLRDGKLWEYVDRGQLADLAPLISRQAGRVFLVPGRDGRDSRDVRGVGARVVVTERLCDDGFWLPAGVYADHRTLREGTQVVTVRQLLALPGVVDLAGGRSQQYLLGV
jgi:hypothetical protein